MNEDDYAYYTRLLSRTSDYLPAHGLDRVHLVLALLAGVVTILFSIYFCFFHRLNPKKTRSERINARLNAVMIPLGILLLLLYFWFM